MGFFRARLIGTLDRATFGTLCISYRSLSLLTDLSHPSMSHLDSTASSMNALTSFGVQGQNLAPPSTIGGRVNQPGQGD